MTDSSRPTLERSPVAWFDVVERNTLFSLLVRHVSDDEGEFVILNGGLSRAEQARRLQPRLFDVEAG